MSVGLGVRYMYTAYVGAIFGQAGSVCRQEIFIAWESEQELGQFCSG